MRLGRRPRSSAAPLVAALVVFGAIVLTGCSALLEPAPTPTPQPFPGITGELGRVGIDVISWRSGDAGCADSTLAPTAVQFTAEGLDQPTPVELRIYIFRNRETWERRLPDVEACAAGWATDPSTFELLPVSPYVVAGQGPWPSAFEAAMRAGIIAAAGTGD